MDRVTRRLWRGVEESVPSVAEGTSALLISPCCCLGCFFFKLPQNRHPERSAAQMDRVTQRLWRGVEGPALPNLPMLLVGMFFLQTPTKSSS